MTHDHHRKIAPNRQNRPDVDLHRDKPDNDQSKRREACEQSHDESPSAIESAGQRKAGGRAGRSARCPGKHRVACDR